MNKIIDFLYYGNLTLEKQENVYRDIEEANRKSVIAYSTISMVAFICMAVFATVGNNVVSKNKLFYVIGTLIMAAFLVMNATVAKKHPKIIHFTAYLFVVAILAIGILLAISSKGDVTASYMVFLFVAPLLFILRPLYVIIVILGVNVGYIVIMHAVQTPEMFQKNIVNAVIYGIVSIFVSTTMIRMRIQKFETDHMNRVLMETDQLTGMLNRRSFEQHIDKLQALDNVKGIKLCAFDINGLKQVNDNIGHHAGDELLRGAAVCLEHVFAPYGSCYRIGGDEFFAILQDSSPDEGELKQMLEKQTLGFKGTYVPSLSISVGIVVGEKEDTVADLLREADARMYENKAEYYKNSGIDRRKRK